jgi:hypothetical protein
MGAAASTAITFATWGFVYYKNSTALPGAPARVKELALALAVTTTLWVLWLVAKLL